MILELVRELAVLNLGTVLIVPEPVRIPEAATEVQATPEPVDDKSCPAIPAALFTSNSAANITEQQNVAKYEMGSEYTKCILFIGTINGYEEGVNEHGVPYIIFFPVSVTACAFWREWGERRKFRADKIDADIVAIAGEVKRFGILNDNFICSIVWVPQFDDSNFQ